jgi:hypothetical protein
MNRENQENNEILVTIILNQTQAITLRGTDEELMKKIKEIRKGLFITRKIYSDLEDDDVTDKIMVVVTDSLLNCAIWSLKSAAEECSSLI